MSLQRTANQVASISAWIDEWPVNQARDPEALMWHRIAKPAEEAGEVIDEMIKFIGGNPRKQQDVGNDVLLVEELLDTALAALAAVEHLRGNRGVSLALLADKAERVWIRAQGGSA